MADDKSKSVYRDKTRINMNQAYEVAYWKKRFGACCDPATRDARQLVASRACLQHTCR
jgi:hypothetical protein